MEIYHANNETTTVSQGNTEEARADLVVPMETPWEVLWRVAWNNELPGSPETIQGADDFCLFSHS